MPLDFSQYARRLHALAIFRGLLRDEVIARFSALLDGGGLPPAAKTERYADFVSALYASGGDFGGFLLQRVLESDNPVVRLRAAGRRELPELADSLAAELALFTELAALSPEEAAEFAGGGPLPAYRSTAHDFTKAYTRRLCEAPTRGFGIFASYRMFTLGEGAALRPVRNPDPQRLAELAGYENERRQVIKNTEALLAGLCASNVLLYGDAGTGKSSTVKALANEYWGRGLRLVEVRGDQLGCLPLLMDMLADNPLKFILFIDDLSFSRHDAGFTSLKAVLEGNVSARPANVAVYATSNRRHLLRQRFSDRMGEEVHLNDTLEEEASLSARFGIVVTFQKPDKALYGEIVRALAKRQGLELPGQELAALAEARALRCGGRSPRAARQLVEQLRAESVLGAQDAPGESVKSG